MKHVARITALALLCGLLCAAVAAAQSPSVRNLSVAGEHGGLVGKLQEDAPRTYNFTGRFTFTKASKDKFRPGSFKLALVFLRDGVKVDEVEVPLRAVGDSYLVDQFHFRTCCEFTKVSFVLK